MSFRWSFRDTETDEVFELKMNPNEMSSPYSRWDTEFWSTSLLSRSRRARRQPFMPIEWTFSGVSLTKENHNILQQLARREAKLELTDHLGRSMTVRMVAFAPSQKAPKRLHRPWRMTYEVKCLIYSRPSRITP